MNIPNPNLPTYPTSFNSTTTTTQFSKAVNGNVSINNGFATNSNLPANLPTNLPTNSGIAYNSVPMSGSVSGGGDNSDFLRKIDEQL